MEDVLEVYTRPYTPARPQICVNEINTQLLVDIRDPLPMEPDQPARLDYEYARPGVCNVFLACEPLTGQRSTMVAAQRTTQEWTLFIRQLADLHYPDAEKIVLVMITSIRTRSLHSTRSFRKLRRVGSLNALRCITRAIHGSPAQHGGDRALGVGSTMLVGPVGLLGDRYAAGRHLDHSAQPAADHHQLALYR